MFSQQIITLTVDWKKKHKQKRVNKDDWFGLNDSHRSDEKASKDESDKLLMHQVCLEINNVTTAESESTENWSTWFLIINYD